jgi:hypothetical protein
MTVPGIDRRDPPSAHGGRDDGSSDGIDRHFVGDRFGNRLELRH